MSSLRLIENQSRKCSFRFLLILHPTQPMYVVTQDMRRSKRYVTGQYPVRAWATGRRALQELARKHGCSMIIRAKGGV